MRVCRKLRGDGCACARTNGREGDVGANENGVVDPGELKSLADLGIVPISVASTAATSTVNGNTITSTATFQRADGSTGTVADVTLGVDNFNTLWLGHHSISASDGTDGCNIRERG